MMFLRVSNIQQYFIQISIAYGAITTKTVDVDDKCYILICHKALARTFFLFLKIQIEKRLVIMNNNI